MTQEDITKLFEFYGISYWPDQVDRQWRDLVEAQMKHIEKLQQRVKALTPTRYGEEAIGRVREG